MLISYKLNDMTLDEKYKLLLTDDTPVKRPILIKDDNVTVTFKEQAWEEFLKD